METREKKQKKNAWTFMITLMFLVILFPFFMEPERYNFVAWIIIAMGYAATSFTFIILLRNTIREKYGKSIQPWPKMFSMVSWASITFGIVCIYLMIFVA